MQGGVFLVYVKALKKVGRLCPRIILSQETHFFHPPRNVHHNTSVLTVYL